VHENLIVLSVPVFLVLLVIEHTLAYVLHKNYFRIGDTVNSVSLGTMEQLVGSIVGIGPGIAMFAAVSRLAPWKLPADSVFTWILSFLVADLLYYWWHRTSHRVNLFWAGHVVHHQSEEYNLSTALRQSWATSVTISVFTLPIALLGVPWEVYFLSIGVIIIYQFWIHTRMIGRLGPLEWIFNTPSHHRVHHGVNPHYIDKNYAGVLILWDRMFGTFESEGEEAYYGLVHPVKTWNPLHNSFEFWIELFRRSYSDHGVWGRFRHWIVAPEWTPENPHPPLILNTYRPSGYLKFEPKTTRTRRIIGLGLFALVLVVSAVYLRERDHLTLLQKMVCSAGITAALMLIAWLSESRDVVR
jgi:alkylglycerol monooxygenase